MEQMEMELELEQDNDFQEKNWKAERVAWIIMTLIIIAALSGILGIGPLSKRTLGSAEEGFKVEFHSLLRYRKEVPMRITIKPNIYSTDYRIRINKTFLKGMTTEKIVPEPEITYIGKDDYIYSFRLVDATAETTIAFYMKPETTGNKKLIIGEENGESKEMDIFIYP